MSTLRQRNGIALPWVWRAPRWLREIVLVGIIYGGYELSRGVTKSTFAVAERNGWGILHWERAWDIDPERLLTHGLISVTPLAVAAAYFYSTMHYLITPVVLIWMYRCHSDRYRAARTSLAISTIIGLVGFYLVPTAPPRLLNSGIPDALSHVQRWGWWGNEGSVPRGLGSLTNQFAAMPSMHVGWALWCGVLLWRHSSNRWARWAGVAYPVLTTLVVLATGNHYLLDAVAGALVMGLGVLLTMAFTRLSIEARRRTDCLDAKDGDHRNGDDRADAPADRRPGSHSLFVSVSANSEPPDQNDLPVDHGPCGDRTTRARSSSTR